MQDSQTINAEPPPPPPISSDAPRIANQSQRALILGLAILALTALAYLPAMRGSFLWDDDDHFSENPYMTSLAGLKALWVKKVFYYPLTSTSFWVARHVWGLNPVPYHQLNILLHVASAILLWQLLRRLKIRAAWLGGAVFALHPVCVQSVAWMTELKNMQSGFFYLLALHAWLSVGRFGPKRHEIPETNPILHRNFYYAAALLFFVIAMLSKSSTVTLPLALVVIELWRRPRLDRAFFAAWLPFPILSFVAGVATVILNRGTLSGLPEWDETFPQRLILASRGVCFYFSKLVYPVQLSFVYPRWTVDPARPAQWLWLAGLALVFGALWAGRRSWGRSPLLALAYYTVSLLPVLNFWKIFYTRYSYVADHWQYLALMGGAAWIAAGSDWFLTRLHANIKIKSLATAALLALLFALTWRQAAVYQSNETLWQDVLSKNPSGSLAYSRLAYDRMKRGENAEAEQVLAAGLLRSPENPELLTLHGSTLVFLNRPREALVELEHALKRYPDDPIFALNHMAMAHEALGRTEDALKTYNQSIELKPENVPTYLQAAAMVARAGRPAEALAILDRGLRANPGNPALTQMKNEIQGH